ncbi:response regulator [Jiella sp. M17.18]|uniref:response regulator n=1 Tax=Jiella sp. M17.18 TaxID=3234247 RepID=UPI0034DF266F
MQTCLVIDEAPVIRKIASRLILQFGLAVECAATLAESRAWIDENGLPDIVIVSVGCSDQAGVDFVRELRQRSGKGQTVILAAIVEANLGLMTRLRRAGVTGYIYKPFDRQALIDWLSPFISSEQAA